MATLAHSYEQNQICAEYVHECDERHIVEQNRKTTAGLASLGMGLITLGLVLAGILAGLIHL